MSLAAEQSGSAADALAVLRAEDVEDLLPEIVRLAVLVDDRTTAEQADDPDSRAGRGYLGATPKRGRRLLPWPARQ